MRRLHLSEPTPQPARGRSRFRFVLRRSRGTALTARLSGALLMLGAFGLAGVGAVAAAITAVDLIEDRSEIDTRAALDAAGYTWAEVQADGLQIRMSGTAPSEVFRTRAISAVGQVIDAARVIDGMDVAASDTALVPEFSVEILRNDAGVSLIGLVPLESDTDAFVETVAALAGGRPVSNFLEPADYPAPETWAPALGLALEALELLPRSQISIGAQDVEITGSAPSEEEKLRIESVLRQATPRGVNLRLDIRAPRPVIAPFTLRLQLTDGEARLLDCSAHTESGRSRILAAAIAAGLPDPRQATCPLGLGVPSPNWPDAAELAIAALAELGGGTVQLSDVDVTLTALQGTDESLFDRVVGRLENDLPEVFTLYPVLPRPDASDEGPPWFRAQRSETGEVLLLGRLSDDLQRAATESVARAEFGDGAVQNQARLVDGLPEGWTLRVIAGIEALGLIDHGTVEVDPDRLRLAGVTGDAGAASAASRLLAERLGEGETFEVNVRYEEALDPEASLPTPEECIAQISAVLAERKITFEPGSTTIDADARVSVERIAEILRNCPEMALEVAGHTDSQGREEMNLQLSQSRAEAVLAELMAERIPTSGITAVGYGETRPIADNETEEGRERNRRIEFTLAVPGEAADGEAAAAEAVADGEGAAAEGADEATQAGESAGTEGEDGE